MSRKQSKDRQTVRATHRHRFLKQSMDKQTDRTPVNGMSGVEETKHGQTDSQSDRHRLLNYGYPRNRASTKQSKDRQTDRTPVNGMSGVEETKQGQTDS